MSADPADRGSTAGALATATAPVVDLEQALLRRAQKGDRQALKSLLERHADALLYRVILPRVGERSSAEDILKMTLLTAVEKIDTIRWQDRSIYFWLRQVAVNKVIDYHRATTRRRKLADSLAQEPLLSAQPPSAEAALIAEQERQQNRERIDRALAQVNPRYRQAIELRLIEELSREECAAQLEVTVGTFDVLFHRALKAFRKVFG